MSWVLYFVDTELSSADRTQFSLRWAKQIASQVEVLALQARERHEVDPIASAAQALTGGTDPQLIQIAPERNGALIQDPESYRLNPKTGALTYFKILNPQTGEGVRIHIQLGYLGFLGSRTAWVSDLWVVTLFGLIVTFLSTFLAKLRKRAATACKIESAEVLEWANTAKAGLLHLGIQIRDVVRESQNLAVAAAKSRAHVELLDRNSSVLHQIFLDLEGALHEGDAGLEKVRIALAQFKIYAETLALDSSTALNSYQDVGSVTQALNEHINQTTAALLAEAKLLQEFKTKIGSFL